MTAPVVVGVDGSATSADALCWALEVAAASGASLEVVRAGNDSALAEARDALEAARRRLEGSDVEARDVEGSDVQVEVLARPGEPSSVLLEREASLLVLGRHGAAAVTRRLVGQTLGSIAGRCLDRSLSPVAVVPPGAPAGRPERVVVGVDGSSSSRRAVSWAAEHARATGAPLTAVLAWQLTTLPAPPSPAGTIAPLPEWEQSAREVLAATVGAAVAAASDQVEQVVLHRPAAAGLLETVQPGDVLVLGARGRGGFTRLLLGSVSRQCAEHAPCVVVVVPHGHREDAGG